MIVFKRLCRVADEGRLVDLAILNANPQEPRKAEAALSHVGHLPGHLLPKLCAESQIAKH